MKGEYTGADGRQYRWRLTHGGRCSHQVPNAVMGGVPVDIAPVDWPKAKAALDELLEEDWVEWSAMAYDFRCRPDGSDFQSCLRGTDNWVLETEDVSSIPATFRAGFKRGEQGR